MTRPLERHRPTARAARLSRRQFLLGGLSALTAESPRRVDLRIGLLLPPGPLAPSILRGAKMGIGEADTLARMFGKRITLTVPSVPGPDRLAGIATRLSRDGVSVFVGGDDERAADLLRGVASERKALFLNVGSASDRLRADRCDRYTFHLHASVEMHLGAAALWLSEEKRLRRWAVLTEAEEIRRAVHAFAEARGATVVGISPAVSGTTDWRPTLEGLRAAAPEALWLGLRAGQVETFLRHYSEAGLAAELVGITPDAVGLPKMEAGALRGVWPVMWHHTLERYSARELNSRHKRRFGEALDGASWSTWAALKLLGEGMLRAGATPEALLEYFESDPRFDGHKGRPLSFRRRDHQLRQPMYLTQAGKTDGVTPVAVIAEVPRGDLDQIFLPPTEGGCPVT